MSWIAVLSSLNVVTGGGAKIVDLGEQSIEEFVDAVILQIELLAA